jgi:hypothetical protein
MANPVLPSLFQDQDRDAGFFGGGDALHTNPLWALEALAWSPQYLSRVAVCFAQLAARDPGGRWSNRPARSLHEVFLSWLWHTNTTIPERIQAIETILQKEHPEGWKMLVKLLPAGRDTSCTATHMPRWQRWADGWSRDETRKTRFQYEIALGELAIRTAGEDLEKWADAVDGILRISHQVTEKALQMLEALSQKAAELQPEPKCIFWSVLRNLIVTHQQYPDAEWTFRKPTLERLSIIRDRFVPDDPLLTNKWLSDPRAELPDISRIKWREREQALYERRIVALEEIIKRHGNTACLQMIKRGYDPGNVGWIAGTNDAVLPESSDLREWLVSNDAQLRVFARCFVAKRFQRFKWDFVRSLSIEKWETEQVAALMMCLPFDPDTWDYLDTKSPEIIASYWSTMAGFISDPTVEKVGRVVDALLNVGRGFYAIAIVQSAAYQKTMMPSDVVAKVLEFAGGEQNADEQEKGGGSQHSGQELIKRLQEDAAFDRVRLMRIEWKYLAWLDPMYSETRPVTLEEMVHSDPSVFVELLTKVYRAKSEQHEDSSVSERSEEDYTIASQAQKLLERISRLPGTDGDGKLDMAYFREWVTKARELASSVDRSDPCDWILAGLIVRCTRKKDGEWPTLELVAFVEQFGTPAFFSHFVLEVMNSRGATMSDPFAGGDQERGLADRFRRLADYCQTSSPRLADAFRQVAVNYDHDANREDEESLRRRLGR